MFFLLLLTVVSLMYWIYFYHCRLFCLLLFFSDNFSSVCVCCIDSINDRYFPSFSTVVTLMYWINFYSYCFFIYLFLLILSLLFFSDHFSSLCVCWVTVCCLPAFPSSCVAWFSLRCRTRYSSSSDSLSLASALSGQLLVSQIRFG